MSCAKQTGPPTGDLDTSKDYSAVLYTENGNITIELFDNKDPLTVENFINLAKSGFYNGVGFHRVIAGFMAQTGDPTGTGTGGPGYTFEDEIVSELKHDGPGILSMANAGPGTNGSQFFITHLATPWLDNHHTIFGGIQDSDDQVVVDKICQGDKIITIKIIGDLPSNKSIDEQIQQWDTILDNNSNKFS